MKLIIVVVKTEYKRKKPILQSRDWKNGFWQWLVVSCTADLPNIFDPTTILSDGHMGKKVFSS